MRKNTIKATETIEKIVRVEWIADDGVIFYDQEECRKYEESALFAVSKRLKRLTHKWENVHDLIGEGTDECEVEIFDVQTEDDLENLRRYLYLKAIQNGASENSIKGCFESEVRNDFTFDNVTAGHEVLIFWVYDTDWFWVYRDGSLDGYFSWVKDNYIKMITPKEDSK